MESKTGWLFRRGHDFGERRGEKSYSYTLHVPVNTYMCLTVEKNCKQSKSSKSRGGKVWGMELSVQFFYNLIIKDVCTF